MYAGLVGGPIAGLGAALIGGLFRFFVYGGGTAVPCMLACFLAGIIGTVIHLVIKKDIRYNVLTGIIAAAVTEGCHMLILCAFGVGEIAGKIAIPIIVSGMLAMAFTSIRNSEEIPQTEKFPGNLRKPAFYKDVGFSFL